MAHSYFGSTFGYLGPIVADEKAAGRKGELARPLEFTSDYPFALN